MIRGIKRRLKTGSEMAGWHLVVIFLFIGLPASSQIQNHSSPTTETDFQTFSTKADAARDADKLEEAQALYKKALVLHPRWAEGWWSLGTIAYDRNAYIDADRAFQKVTALAPKNGNAYVMLGLSEFELGHDAMALKHLEKGLGLGIDNDANLRYVTLYHQGVLLQRAGKYHGAQEILEQLCLQGVESDDAIKTLGMVLLRQRNTKPPVAGSADAEVVSIVGRAGCFAGQKKFDEAKKELSVVVEQHSDYPNIHYAFGVVLLEASDAGAAVGEFQKGIGRNPTDVISRLQIAASTYKINSAEGIPYAKEAVELAPQQPFAHYLLGMLLLDTDDYAGAIPELEIAEKAFPQEAKIYFALGTAYSRAGRKQDAALARATFVRLTAGMKESAGENQMGQQATGEEKIQVGDINASPQ
jgi:tetratricopeptide (TPR) repeat protein